MLAYFFCAEYMTAGAAMQKCASHLNLNERL